MANENIRVGADMTSFDQSMEQSAKKAEQSFYDIVNSVKKSSSNVKKELREVQNAMTSMLANGVSPASAEYQKLAQRAGELKDAIGDVTEEINAQASDTRNMTLAFGALGDGITAFQAGQAALSAFGLESEDAAKAIQKMMAAQQLLTDAEIPQGKYLFNMGFSQGGTESMYAAKLTDMVDKYKGIRFDKTFAGGGPLDFERIYTDYVDSFVDSVASAMERFLKETEVPVYRRVAVKTPTSMHNF